MGSELNLEQTRVKKLFVVSDIHGHYTILKKALEEAGFDPENEEHLLVCCGDYFDRGTENYRVLKYFERLKHKVLLRGNHEDMLLKILKDGRLQTHNYLNGTVETIIEFFGKYSIDQMGEVDFSGKTRMADRITEFITETQDYFETKNYVFVHGWLPTVAGKAGICIDEHWRNASEDKWKEARWTKWSDMYLTCDRLQDKTIVCGHLPTFLGSQIDSTRTCSDGGIFYGENVIAIDAGTYTTKKVNVLVIEESLLQF